MSARDQHDGSKRRPRVALAEDDATLRSVLAEYLMEEGFDVAEADDGVALLALLEGDHDIVVTDIEMPGLGGLEVMALVRLEEPALPFICLTGRTDAEIRERAAALGVSVVLTKPLEVRLLSEHIRAALRG